MSALRVVREAALIGGLAAGFVLGTQAAAARQPLIRHELDGLGYALLVAAACALAWRIRSPRLALAAVLLLVGAYLVIGYPYSPVLFAVSIAVFAVLDRSPIRQAPWVTVLAWGALALPQLPSVNPANPLGDAAVLLAESAALVLPAAALAIIRQRTRQAHTAEQRRALAEERLMLAREVHDIVAHNLSMAAVQAGAALKVIDRDPERQVGAAADPSRQPGVTGRPAAHPRPAPRGAGTRRGARRGTGTRAAPRPGRERQLDEDHRATADRRHSRRGATAGRAGDLPPSCRSR